MKSKRESLIHKALHSLTIKLIVILLNFTINYIFTTFMRCDSTAISPTMEPKDVKTWCMGSAKREVQAEGAGRLLFGPRWQLVVPSKLWAI